MKNLNEQICRIRKVMGLNEDLNTVSEDITTMDKPVEDTFLTKALNSLSSFIRGKELNDLLNNKRQGYSCLKFFT